MDGVRVKNYGCLENILLKLLNNEITVFFITYVSDLPKAVYSNIVAGQKTPRSQAAALLVMAAYIARDGASPGGAWSSDPREEIKKSDLKI